jgi:P pilus assembly chaperone PapD
VKEMSMEPAIDESGKVYIPMTRSTKAALLFVCFSLCALGAVLSPTRHAQEPQRKSEMLPVNNHQSHRGIWLRV